MQQERSGTLGVSQDQTLIQAYGIGSYDSNGMKSPNPYSGIYKADTTRTLDLNGGSPACNQGGIAVVYPLEGNGQRGSHFGNGYGDANDPSFTLNTVERHAVAFGIDQQGGKGGANYAENISPPILSDSHGTPHAVAFTQNQRDEVRDLADVAGSVSAEPGTHQTTYVATAVDCRNGTEDPDVNGTLQATSGHNLNSNNIVRTQACDVYNQTVEGDIAPTVTAAAGGTNTSGPKVLTAGFSFGQSANARSLGYEKEKSPTIRGGEGGNQKPVVLQVDEDGTQP